MRQFSHSSSLKSIFEKLGFRDGLIWTVRLVTVEIKLCFQISPAWLARGAGNKYRGIEHISTDIRQI